MKEKKDCKIIQDLLPNYIEKLTNKETNIYVEEHLRECTECQKIHENMQKELNTNRDQIDEREVNFIKKYSEKLGLLKLIIILILAISLAIMTYFYFYFK